MQSGLGRSACPGSHGAGGMGTQGQPEIRPRGGDSLAVESRTWDQDCAFRPLLPARPLRLQRQCAATSLSFPGPLLPPSSCRAVESRGARCAGPGQHGRPQVPAGEGEATRCRFAGAPRALASVLADSQSGDEGFANLGGEEVGGSHQLVSVGSSFS